MLDKTRYDESCKLISNHLVKSHEDNDVNSLRVRFGEICHYVEDLEDQKRSLDSLLKALTQGRF